MKHHKRTREGGLLLLSMAALAVAVSGSYDWRWGQPQMQCENQNHDIDLTDRNGSRAADMYCLSNSNVHARAIFEAGNNIWVLSVEDGIVQGGPVQPCANAAGERPCVVISTGCTYVGALWYQKTGDSVKYCNADWPSSWNDPDALSDGAYNAAIAIGEGYTLGDAPYTYACYRADPTGGSDGVWFQICYGQGQNWDEPVQISTDPADQITVLNENPLGPIVAYHYKDGETHKIKVWKSWNCGYEGTWDQVVFDPPLEGVAQPCIVVHGYHAAMCWVRAPEGGDPTAGGKVEVCWSDNFFYSHNGPVAVGSYSSDPDLVYNAPTMSMVPTSASPYHSNLVIVSELYDGHDSHHDRWLSATNGLVSDDAILWRGEHYMPGQANVAGEDANPCVDADVPHNLPAKAYCFYTAPVNAHRALYRLDADYVSNLVPLPPVHFDGIGRRIWLDPNGDVSYAARVGANVHAGQVFGDNSLQPVLVSGGGLPALALDSAGKRWVSYWRDDTIWCMLGDGSYKMVFAGCSTAVPGQPSIVCYPSQANGVYVANVVFPVYDTAGSASRIMYARVDTGHVVLDTIESVANLGDSLPCINVYATDSLLVTWQHGDSVLSSLLADYRPDSSGQPGVWSSPSLVTTAGYHPMSALDEGSSILNCVWTEKSGSFYTVRRATTDLDDNVFGTWTPSATSNGSSTSEKGNSVYAGLGVSVWQEKDARGRWAIKGYVRGEETTLVANDTDAYHPHAFAESSAVSPSIDQVRVHLLYTAGVTFEVDSGVYDTGEARFKACSFNVSHAGSDATKYNNGSKLLRKAGSDSLFAVYTNLDDAVMYARSAAGDSWLREVMLSDRDWPAIAEDSSGKRWVVARKVNLQSTAPDVQEIYYRDDTSWVGPETLFANAQSNVLGPASIAGASNTATGIVYAAFLASRGPSQLLILAKFNGSVVSTCVVAAGTSLGDPVLAVEPYLADSDRVHVSWEDHDVIWYRVNTDGRSSIIASNWTSAVALSPTTSVSQHPCISADRGQIVAAWAQALELGDTTDIYCRKRSTDSAYNNWEAAANLSNTANDASDYPTVAIGDTVVVAWQEARTGGGDFDILACIDFGDTLNIANNATFSTYPHVLFQNKASGDTAIPYLHTIWSETPEAEYYEVGYSKLNLKQASGGGQQSASSTPIPVKPSLAACRPNPFKSHTQISYALPTAGKVSLRVYDVTGRSVRTLASGHQKAGNYSVGWDAKDSHGKQVPYGVYFYRLETPGFRAVKKAVVTR